MGRFQKLHDSVSGRSQKAEKQGGHNEVGAVDVGHQKKALGPKAVTLDLDLKITATGKSITVRKLLSNCAKIGCTITELAAVLGLSEQGMHNVFKNQPEVRALWDRSRGEGKVSLRQKLYKLAEKNAGAAIFLAKNELGMRDQFAVTAEVEHTHSVSALLKELDGKFGKQIDPGAVPSLSDRATG